MNKLFLRKVLLALLLAVAMPFIVLFVVSFVKTELVLSAGNALSFSALLNMQGAMVLILLLAVIGFVLNLLMLFFTLPRRRRYRPIGTLVEDDIDDGRERGAVKWFNVKKGFGFITWDNGEDVFVHFRSIRGEGHRSLNEGQKVKFQVVSGRKGLQAEDVSAVKD